MSSVRLRLEFLAMVMRSHLALVVLVSFGLGMFSPGPVWTLVVSTTFRNSDTLMFGDLDVTRHQVLPNLL